MKTMKTVSDVMTKIEEVKEISKELFNRATDVGDEELARIMEDGSDLLDDYEYMLCNIKIRRHGLL